MTFPPDAPLSFQHFRLIIAYLHSNQQTLSNKQRLDIRSGFTIFREDTLANTRVLHILDVHGMRRDWYKVNCKCFGNSRSQEEC